MRAHTKGPWTAHTLTVRARGCVIAAVMPQHNAHANAALIAAAPALLMELVCLVQYADELGLGGDDPVNGGDVVDTLNALLPDIRAVIRKARGEGQ